MLRASFRAGTITVTSGASAGASADSSSSERESRRRQSVTTGCSNHGSAATYGVQLTCRLGPHSAPRLLVAEPLDPRDPIGAGGAAGSYGTARGASAPGVLA